MLIDTNNPPSLDQKQNLWLYNGIDCCVTQDVLAETKPQLDAFSSLVYSFERAQWAPALEMMLRGIRIDNRVREELRQDLSAKRTRILHILDLFSHAVWDRPLNHNSPKQLQEFFYTTMKLPEQHKFDKGVRRVSTDREALEKLYPHLYARPMINCILALRDIDKKLSVINMKLCPDGRFRCSYNPSGTETGRYSSSASAFRTGTNSQNISDELRRMFIPDPGMKLGYADLEQAESRGVAYITGDVDYIEACESGDLHTTVAKMIWRELHWPHEPKGDRALADQPFYRHFSRRDISKRAGHGCVTEDHEVLTPNGWVSIATKPSVIMTWDGTTSDFTTVTNWTDKLYTGQMVEILGTSVSINMTADHRVILTKDRKGCKLHEIPAEKFSTVRGDIPLGSGYSGPNPIYYARLVAAIHSDAHEERPGVFRFHMHKERKFERLAWLCELAGVRYKRSLDKATVWLHEPIEKAAGPWMLSWTRESLCRYLDEYKYWDGHEGITKSVSLFSTNKEHLEWIQTLGRLVGYGGNFQKTYISGFGSAVHRLQQNNRLWGSGSSMVVRDYEDTVRVLCPTVASGMFYIKRQGKIHITGNSNYRGKPPHMAKILKVQRSLIEAFQENYFQAFPGIPKWHQTTASELHSQGFLITPLGRRRFFLGRRYDDATLREAIAYRPQSTIVDILNIGLWRVWRSNLVQVLGQIHDAILFQYPEHLEAELLPKVLELMRVPVPINGRVMEIPVEVSVGWNWAKADDENPYGLRKYKGGSDDRICPEHISNPPQGLALLDKRIR